MLSAFHVALVIKNLLASAVDIRDMGLIPGSGRSLGGEHGNPLQYSCLENPMDRGALQDVVHRNQTESDMTEATEHAHVISLLHQKSEPVFCWLISHKT